MTGARPPAASSFEVRLPDLGTAGEVTVLEVLVKVGDQVEKEQALLTLESEKATMDVPAMVAGKVSRILVQPGDKVSTGTAVLELEGPGQVVASAVPVAAPAAPARPTPRQAEPFGGEPYLDTIPIQPLPAGAPAGNAAAAAGSKPAAAPSPVPASFDYDVLVVGAGPGGYTAAFRAADLGLKVALVERWPTLGGVCLNVGCIPSKALLHAAKVIEDARAMASHGIEFGAPKIDAARLRDWKNKVVGRLTTGLTGLARQRKVTVIRGVAAFAGTHAASVTGEDGVSQRVTFAHCVIAAGSESLRLPGLPDDPRIIDSTGALELDLPRRMLVVGGGIIGLEMATVYAALGVKVGVVELTEGLMPGCDRDLVRPLEKRIAARYEAIMLRTRVTGVEALSEGLRVTFEGEQAPEPQLYDKVLVAVGRTPNGGKLGCDVAGVLVNERGYIPVDRQQRTNVPHIFAIGDVVGQPMLAHKATHEAKVAAEVIAGHKRFFDARSIPSVAYTDPEIAWAGLTETDAKAKGIAFEKAVFPWAASGRSLANGRDEGFTKLLFDPQTHRVIGGGIVGTSAGDLISEVMLAIEMGADAADIGLTIHPHPTLSETVAMAAEAFDGTLTDLYIPQRGTARK
ncbi:MAG: dihydrolipoyl dehydrogenase [Gammaproteobacteria bacterium]|nr:dihydrolipoyl dehydrogenase [Gammaproteobacteria bacterium]